MGHFFQIGEALGDAALFSRVKHFVLEVAYACVEASENHVLVRLEVHLVLIVYLYRFV